MYRVWKARKFRRATLWRADLLVERKRSAARRAIQVWMERLLRAGNARKTFQRNLLLCMMKVWDVREGQFFWLNQFTKVPTWNKVITQLLTSNTPSMSSYASSYYPFPLRSLLTSPLTSTLFT